MTRRPTAPKHLDADAARKWKELVGTLQDAEPTTLDLAAAYCQAWSRMLAAEAKVSELGLVTRSAQGFAQENPFLRIAQAERRAVRQLAEQLRKRRPAAKASENEDPILRLLTAKAE